MTRGKLLDHPNDDRNFEEQMQDLGVEVKRQSNVLRNMTWLSTRGKATPLGNRISVNKSYIKLGGEAYTALTEAGGGEKLRFATAEYMGQKVIVIKTDKAGYKIYRNKQGYAKTGSPAITAMIEDKGLPLGFYTVKKAKGGIICFPEARQ